MPRTELVWVDNERCTGCGVCVDVCAVEAISLVDGKATVDEGTCTGCGACLDVCPQEAIQTLVQGVLVPAGEHSLERLGENGRLEPAVSGSSPLVQAAGPAVAAVGIGLLARTAEALARAVSRWLAEPSRGASTLPMQGRTTREPSNTNGRGRRMRRRRRGR